MQHIDGSHPVFAAFPRRRMRLRGGRMLRVVALALGGLVIAGGILTFGVAVILPDIRTDLTLRDTALPNGSVRVTAGRCRSRLALFQDCSMKLSWRDSAGTHTRELNYLFVEPHFGNWTVTTMTDPSQPGIATTDLGLDRLTNRMVTLGGFSLLMLAVMGGAFVRLFKALRERRLTRAMSEADLLPVAGKLASVSQSNWAIAKPGGGTHTWLAAGRDRPFVLDEAQGLVLALQPRGGGVAFPLDAELKRVDLTADERKRILAAAE